MRPATGCTGILAQADALLEELKQQMQGAIGDVRRIVYDLRPPVLDQLGWYRPSGSMPNGQAANGCRFKFRRPRQRRHWMRR